jgi:hypothetical protein
VRIAATRVSRPAVVLAALVTVSTAIRAAVAWPHSTPRLYPDEYIYAALGRSIGHGNLEIRGATAHFPAILEPLVASPLWRLFPIETAYHLVQAENALAASLAAVPVYLLARFVGLRPGYAYLCAVYALVTPALVVIAFTTADAVAYPIALAAVAGGIRAVDEPTSRRQLAFLALAVLATLARVQYFVLVPAYVLAALVVDRRAAFRRHRIAFLSLVPALVLALLAAVGYYKLDIPVTRGIVKWFFLQQFLLALSAGVVIVPGAVAALLRARGRRPVAFAVFVGAFAILLLGEASKVAAATTEFKGRYLFVLLPLIAIAFGVYVKEHRPLRPVVIALAAAVLVAAAQLPLSAYATSVFKTDSQFLFAVNDLENRIGIASGDLLVAVLATVAAAAAVGIAFRPYARPAMLFATAVSVAGTIAATHTDWTLTRSVRAALPADLEWVDHAAHGPVTAVATPVADQKDLLDPLYWNTSIQREVVLDTGDPSDAFAARRVRVGPDGELPDTRGDLLLNDFGTTSVLADATRIARTAEFSLWHPNGRPRFRLLIEGRFYDGWLSRVGWIRAWPLGNSTTGTRLSFTLMSPRSRKYAIHLKLARRVLTVRPGTYYDVTCQNPSGPVSVRFSSRSFYLDATSRPLTVELSGIRMADLPAPTTRAAGVSTCSAEKTVG